MKRVFGHCGVIIVLALTFSACGDEPREGSAQLEVSTSQLQVDTSTIYFSILGDGLVYEAIGGSGSIASQIGSISVRRVPEGRKFIWARGLNERVLSPVPAPPTPPSYFYMIEHGHVDNVGIIAQNQTSAQVITVPVAGDNSQYGVDSLVLMGDYDYVADAPFAGSTDGANITAGVINLSAFDVEGCDVTVQYFDLEFYDSQDRGLESPVGLFDSLPTGVSPNTWPDPLNNWSQSINVATVSGLKVFYVVAKPGMAGRDVMLLITDGPNVPCGLAAPGQVFVRIGGYGQLAVETTIF